MNNNNNYYFFNNNNPDWHKSSAQLKQEIEDNIEMIQLLKDTPDTELQEMLSSSVLDVKEHL